MNAYQLGEAYARNMGVNISRFRVELILLSSVLSACVTAFAGPISFVGIAVPQLMKNLLKTAKPILVIPACFLGGAVFCLFCDLDCPDGFFTDGAQHQLGDRRIRSTGGAVCHDQPEAGLTGNAQRREQLMNRSFVYTENMTVGYDGKALIRDIRLSLEKGQILTLIGPNGAGKSTILKSIIRQLKLVDGAVFLDQKSMEKMSDKEISRKLAVVMTGRMQPELMTCEDIVGTGRYPYTGVLGILSAEDHEKVRSAMELVHAWDLKDRDFSAVSDGQRQRILLARAICQEPEVIVLDEPTSFLDIRHKLELLSILKEMVRKQHVAVLMSLHELDLAQKVSDLVICVHGDRIERCGVPEEIFTDEYIRQLYGVTAGSYNASFGCLEMEPARGKPEVFVIAGGGSGIPVFRQLQRQGIPFATGVLQENDVDYQVAKALAAKVVTERPFEEISEEHYQEAVELMRSCKKVILAVSGFGSMNRRNEELKKEAEKLGILEK